MVRSESEDKVQRKGSEKRFRERSWQGLVDVGSSRPWLETAAESKAADKREEALPTGKENEKKISM